MNSFKLNLENKATIPKRVREALKLKAGDSIFFNIFKDGCVAIGKAEPLDEEYYEGMRQVFTEWNSKEDDEAFAHLQSK